MPPNVKGALRRARVFVFVSALPACSADAGTIPDGPADASPPAADGGAPSAPAADGRAPMAPSTDGGPRLDPALDSGRTGPDAARPVDPCASSPWTCVSIRAGEPYGKRTLVVPARQNWVNTGLYLRVGERAVLRERGTWSVTGSGDSIDHGTCKIGDVVARIGLHYKDAKLTCVRGESTLVADKDGIVFVGALAGNDLGESYETRADDSGEKTVDVEAANGAAAPTVQAEDADAFEFSKVTAGHIEVWGKHVILTLPLATAKKDAATLRRATERLDAIYDFHTDLRGAQPHAGQRLRFFPDGTNPGYMLAGNPIRMVLSLADASEADRISRAGEPGVSVWGFAHEMGHDFSFAPFGFWTYQDHSLESWPNVFSVYSLEKLGLPLHAETASCTASSKGSFANGAWDPWTGLCFLRQFQFNYGWDVYKKFFRSLGTTKSTGNGWYFTQDKLALAAGKDVSPTFAAWGVPYH